MNTDLLQRYITGDVSEKEALEVAKWIAESEEHQREYHTVRKLQDILLWQTGAEDIPYMENSHVASLKVWDVHLLRVAATVVLVIFSLTYWWTRYEAHQSSAPQQSIYTPNGQRAELVLADGTRVWLNSNTTLRYNDFTSADIREVELNGEGYFSVAKNTDKPFIVKTNRYHIKVLGTEFNVSAYASTSVWSASLVRGKIDIDAIDGSRLMELEPNTEAYLENGSLMKRGINSAESAFKWRKGQISFDNQSMQNIIRKLENCYDVRIVVRNKHILQGRYTGTFAIRDGVSHILDVLSTYEHFSYTLEKDNQIIIY